MFLQGCCNHYPGCKLMDKIDKIVAENQDVWKTRSQFFTWMKGVIRKGWTKHPVRTKKLDAECVMIENTNPRSKKRYPFVKGNKCEICGGIFKREFIETDHILEETAKLTEIEHIQECVEKLLIVCAEDTRILCKDCHEIVSYSQKKGITFDEAILVKKVVKIYLIILQTHHLTSLVDLVIKQLVEQIYLEI